MKDYVAVRAEGNIDFFYQTESAVVGSPVKALHIQELREGVK